MNSTVQSQVEISAVLNLIPYLDTDFNYSGEMKLSDIVQKNEAKFTNKKGELDPTFALLKQAVENPAYGDIVLVDQSSTNSTGAWTDDLIQGCTFRDPDGNYYVAFRGTGDGRWPDNGNGMTAPSTEMQEAAAAYFDHMAEKYLIDASNQGKDIIITGHSKGGNEAQYTYMMAKHEEIIDQCISIDGQGFSESAIESFKKRYGDRYEEKLQEMYSINGENDFVHDLGYTIIPEENTYFVPTSEGEIPNSWHALENMISDDNGNFTNLNWAVDENGNITHGEQGPIGKLAKKISEAMMKLDPEDLNGAAIALMAVVDPYADDEILGSIQIHWTDYLDLLAHGAPVALDVLLTTPEGWAAIQQFLPGILESIYEEHGTVGIIVTAVVAAVALTAAAIVLPAVAGILQVLDAIVDIFTAIINLGEKIVEFVTAIKDAVVEVIQKIAAKLRTYTAGYKYATAHPQIKVDTYKLSDYARRIKVVQGRISALDERLDSLYWQVGLLDLWNLMSADVLTGYSWRLARCAGYLSDTATEFENAEKDLTSKIQ